jgi:hypothetical protein
MHPVHWIAQLDLGFGRDSEFWRWDHCRAAKVMSALSSPLLLFLMWSPKGKTVFSTGYRETIRRTGHLRPGCWGILPAMLTVPAAFATYFVLLLTLLSVLAMLGLIRSI